jgi:hypothetical protein
MNTQLLSEIVGQGTTFALLDVLAQEESGVTRTQLEDFMRETAVTAPDAVFDALLGRGLLSQFGGRYTLTTHGRKAHLLVAGLNGLSVEQVVQELRRLYPELSPYELVRQGMTREFINSLYSRPDFRRAYICSPWIILDATARHHLSQAIYGANELGQQLGYEVDLLCVSHPPEGNEDQKKKMKESLDFLREKLQAEVVTQRRLHSKLYIREPGPSGGLQLAIVGSQNMTGSRNLELGIKITNDGLMIGKLIRYFMDVRSLGEPQG